MKSALKIVLPLLLVGLVVFGATVISQYVLTPPPVDTKPDAVAEPLTFGLDKMYFVATPADPAEPYRDLERRAFPGYFELDGKENPVSFWFANRNPMAVRVAVRGRSCNSCTQARVGLLDPKAAPKALATPEAVALALNFDPYAPDLLGPMVGLAAERSLTWTRLDFEKPDEVAVVPAAAADGTPTRGVLQMMLLVRSIDNLTRDMTVDLTAGTAAPVTRVFEVGVVGVGPFAVTPKQLAVGDMPEGMAPYRTELIIWSATRTLADLPPPAAAVTPPGDPFVSTGPPVPLAAEELSRFAAGLGPHTRVRSAYKVPVAVVRKNPNPGPPSEPDFGPFDRKIELAGAGQGTVSVPVSGLVTGLVSLEPWGEKKKTTIDLEFDGRFGTTSEFALRADRGGIDLAPEPADVQPNYLRAKLEPDEPDGDRARWKLTLTVPAGQGFGEMPVGSGVTFQASTPTGPRKVRVPVTGRGTLKAP